jgi:hypothetical protein
MRIMSAFQGSLLEGQYDVSLQLSARAAPQAITDAQVNILDGVRHCGAAQSCNLCDKLLCVYCADNYKCVPGNDLLGPSGQVLIKKKKKKKKNE